jgi:lipopolysaccharide/colanic/teichoic acid biosynthesis glycosyltransferase
MVQRLFDVLLSLIALVLLLPFFMPIAIALKLTGEGEILYFQSRIGKDGVPFQLCKFATMLKNSPQIGMGTVTVKDDPRILPFGHFLRSSKINELPQLWNILRGDMSVIGPRPLERRGFNCVPPELQIITTSVRPGLSGIGSIVFRNEQDMLDGENDSNAVFDTIISTYKARLEKWYVENQSVRLYFMLILATIVAVLFPKINFVSNWFKDLPVPDAVTRRMLDKG